MEVLLIILNFIIEPITTAIAGLKKIININSENKK